MPDILPPIGFGKGRDHPTMQEGQWLQDARRVSRSRDDFERGYNNLPGKIRQLLKHLDPRSKSMRNSDKELAELSEAERQMVTALLKYHQAFPLNHSFPKERHQNKYNSKAKNQNHLISKDMMKNWDKRN